MVEVNVDANQEDSGSEERFEESAPEPVTIPEGFDARLFDEQGQFSPESAKGYFEEQKKEYEKVVKQRDDFQRVISAKGQVPKSPEEYFDNYKNEKYDTLKSNETVQDAMHSLAETFKDIGLSPKQADKVYDRFFETFEKSGQIDTRPTEMIEADKNAWILEERAKLGESADAIISKSTGFVRSSPIFTDTERSLILGLMDSKQGGAELIRAINKMVVMSSTEGDIPSVPSDNGSVPSDAVLREELMSASEERRLEIHRLRRSVGRKGSLIEMSDVVKGGR